MNSYLSIPTLIPYLTVEDTKASISFYQQAFGFEWKNSLEANSKDTIDHVEMLYKDILIMFAQVGTFRSTKKTFKMMGVESPFTLYIYCDNVDYFYQNAIKKGAESLMEPRDEFWGDRVCLLKDLDGYEWMFAQRNSPI